MKYIVTELGAGHGKPETSLNAVIRRILELFIPKANPDFNHLYAFVRSWHIEVNEQTGVPEREIGFDGEGKPIVAGPVDKNMGFWTDSDMTFDIAQHTQISAEQFETEWNKFLAIRVVK